LPLLVVLSRILPFRPLGDLDSVAKGLEAARMIWQLSAPEPENEAKTIAQSLNGRIPLIYGTADNTDLCAMRWKTLLNENSKQPAFWGAIPELNHNEVVSLGMPSLLGGYAAVFLRNSRDLPDNMLRLDITKGLYEAAGVACYEHVARGASELEELLLQIYLGGYVSYYLALLNGVDPTPVKIIEDLKKSLGVRHSSMGA
jgi:glucose/mannose-6-phosphate isomerase